MVFESLNAYKNVSLTHISSHCQTPTLQHRYMEEGALDTKINSKLKFPWSDRLRILGDVAEGMAFLHDKHDSVHRDLKSANVLLDRENGLLRGKIGDFGMSKFMSQNRTDEQNALQMKESAHDEVDVHKSMTNGLGTWYSIVEFENTAFSCFYRATQIVNSYTNARTPNRYPSKHGTRGLEKHEWYQGSDVTQN